jgi:hypothetical protein
MSSSHDEVERLVQEIADGGTPKAWNLDPESLTERDVRQLMTAAIRAYGRLLDEGHAFLPIDRGEISATDAVRTASALLESADLETFELALWQAWGNRPWSAGAAR